MFLHTFMGFPIQSIVLQAPGERVSLDGTFAAHMFPRRLLEVKIKAASNVGELPRQFVDAAGRAYELLVTKLQKSTVSVGGGYTCGRMEITANYVLVSGPGIDPINLKRELNQLAAFGYLAPQKAASRLELVCSKARKSAQTLRDFLFDDLTSNDFEFIPENANEGCGFIPAHYITRWLGNHAVGKGTFAVQVRVFGSKLGIGKGVLMLKPGINKIQLPASMMKIGPSLEYAPNHAAVLVTTNGIFPFPTHCYMERILSGGNEPSKSYQPKKLSNMIKSLFQSIRVPRTLLQEYDEVSQLDRGKNLKHASLIGVADPTNAVPPGHVFLTGIHGSGVFGDEVFVTRYPCTEPGDGTAWPLVRDKPRAMSQADWTWLQSLHFGAIIFGNPLPGQPPLPNMIAGILRHVHSAERTPWYCFSSRSRRMCFLESKLVGRCSRSDEIC